MEQNLLFKESVLHKSENLPFKIYHTDYARYHWHYEYEFLLANDSEVKCYVNGNQTTLNKGDLLLINRCELHSFISKDNLTAIVIHPDFFTSNEQLEIFKSVTFNSLYTNDSEIGNKIIRLLNDVITCYNDKKFGYQIILKSHFLSIFSTLLENGLYVKNTPSNNNLSTETAMFEYIHNNLNERITLDQLSTNFGYSKSYIIRIFNKHTGQTPTAYINRCKIDLAKQLLSNNSVTDTAFECGFDNVSYFIKTFRSYTGFTPKRYKNSHNGSVKLDQK